MPAGEFEGVHVRGEINEATGTTLINLAMGLMRDTKAVTERIEQKLDKIADERRDEAREHGGLEVRVSTLESAHKGTRRVAYGVAVSIIVAAIGMFIRMIALNPSILGR